MDYTPPQLIYHEYIPPKHAWKESATKSSHHNEEAAVEPRQDTKPTPVAMIEPIAMPPIDHTSHEHIASNNRTHSHRKKKKRHSVEKSGRGSVRDGEFTDSTKSNAFDDWAFRKTEIHDLDEAAHSRISESLGKPNDGPSYFDQNNTTVSATDDGTPKQKQNHKVHQPIHSRIYRRPPKTDRGPSNSEEVDHTFTGEEVEYKSSGEKVEYKSTGEENKTNGIEDVSLWDVFQQNYFIEDEALCDGLSIKVLKATKLAAYVFLFLVVVCGVIATRGSLQVLVTQLYNEIKEEEIKRQRSLTQDAISWLLLLTIVLPDMFKILQCVGQYLFGDRSLPNMGNFIWNQVKEILHVIGLCGLIFKVMPYLGPVESSAVLAVIPAIPCLFHSILYLMKKSRSVKIIVCRWFSGLLLIGGVIAVCIMNNTKAENDSGHIQLAVWMTISCIALSFRWIETYVAYFLDIACKDNTIGTKSSWEILVSRNKGTYITHFVSSILRVVCAVLLFILYFCNGIRGVDATFQQFLDLSETADSRNLDICTGFNSSQPYNYQALTAWNVLPSFFVHIFAAVVVYHCTVVACRLCMQRVCFAVPLYIASPIFVIVALATSEADVCWVNKMFYGTRKEPTISVFVSFAIFLVAWLIQLFLCKRTWGEPIDRLSFAKKLFHLPHYCSAILDLSLLHSRNHIVVEKLAKIITKTPIISKVYIAATMWHESRIEMKQILTSLFKLDLDQFARKAAIFTDIPDSDYYEFEGHIPFDDAMTTENNKRVPNDFVAQLQEVIGDAGRTVHKRDINLGSPKRLRTPYGERFEWILPGGNKLYVHLKDKDKIRHKKRWSQIMYMYYGIGYDLMERNRSSFTMDNIDLSKTEIGVHRFPDDVRAKAENTYFLALDGDVDFEPDALRLLIDRMKQDDKVGATCGRIKPLGSGPVVWYQRFEYAIGHWLQKSAEHVFGCVLCSPGCFSLFRAKALMDDNVMRTYSKLPETPRNYLQYDQGEDRWLCTLLLQQGYRIDYCAAAEAWTYAPEEFKEFFNQRRRWLPSTMANVLDVIESYRRTTRKNTNISYLYIFYTLVLFVSSVLGPSTVLLALSSSIIAVFNFNVWVTYVLVYVPTLAFIFICFKFSTNTQLNASIVLSVLYALAMMAVIVGIIVNIAGEGWYTPTAFFFYILIASFLLAGFLHIHEFGDLLFGVIYFIAIPAGYLFLVVYAICNLNNISWGTRETQRAVLEHHGRQTNMDTATQDEFHDAADGLMKKITKQMRKEEMKMDSCKEAFLSIFRWARNLVLLKSISTMQNVWKNERENQRNIEKEKEQNENECEPDEHTNSYPTYNQEDEKEIPMINELEAKFWRSLIKKYLQPLPHDEKEKQYVERRLCEFRDKVAFGFFFVNGLWIIIMTAMNHAGAKISITIYRDGDYNVTVEPLGFVFLIIFAILLVLQIIGMVVHRYETLLHVIAATNLRHTNDTEKIINDIKEMASHGNEEDETFPNDAGITDQQPLKATIRNYRDFIKNHVTRSRSSRKLVLADNFKQTVYQAMQCSKIGQHSLTRINV